MNHADQILIIILSIVLIIFLILLIWAIVYLLQILHGTKRIVNDTSRLVDSAETVTEVFRNASGPIALVRLVRSFSKAVNKQRRSK